MFSPFWSIPLPNSVIPRYQATEETHCVCRIKVKDDKPLSTIRWEVWNQQDYHEFMQQIIPLQRKDLKKRYHMHHISFQLSNLKQVVQSEIKHDGEVKSISKLEQNQVNLYSSITPPPPPQKKLDYNIRTNMYHCMRCIRIHLSIFFTKTTSPSSLDPFDCP
jgi:hypothetical protein